MVNVLSTLVAIVVLAGLAWVAFTMEPHWVSKDGRRMIARVQPLGIRDEPDGRWREMRVFIDGQTVSLTTRGFGSFALSGNYRAKGKSPEPPRGRAIYVLDGERRVLLRVPAKSRAVPILDSLID